MRPVPLTRMLLAIVIILGSATQGCYYRDFDMVTVDHYSHYGRSHSVDATYHSSDRFDR